MAGPIIQRFLNDAATEEALSWLRRAGSQFRSLGEHSTTEESIALVERAYAAGATSVLAVEIDDDIDRRNTGKLALVLPKAPDARRRVFAWAAEFAERVGF